jgi:hypothetical protein
VSLPVRFVGYYTSHFSVWTNGKKRNISYFFAIGRNRRALYPWVCHTMSTRLRTGLTYIVLGTMLFKVCCTPKFKLLTLIYVQIINKPFTYLTYFFAKKFFSYLNWVKVKLYCVAKLFFIKLFTVMTKPPLKGYCKKLLSIQTASS